MNNSNINSYNHDNNNHHHNRNNSNNNNTQFQRAPCSCARLLRENTPFVHSKQNMRGKVACVTGANSGIGYCVAKSLAARNCTVHMLCRNKARGEDARNRVLSATGNEDVHLHVVDVSDFRQVTRLFFSCAFASGFLPLVNCIFFILRSRACLECVGSKHRDVRRCSHRSLLTYFCR